MSSWIFARRRRAIPSRQPAGDRQRYGLSASRVPLIIGMMTLLTTPSLTGQNPDVSFPGQYRINSYIVDNDDGSEDDQTASRLRIRQDIDLEFDDGLSTHLQVELGHTTGNLTTTDLDLKVRHALMTYRTDRVSVQAGLLPLADRFGDTLFSSDWDYNPLAAAVEATVGPGTLRAFAGTLDEGLEDDADDDTRHYQVDYEQSIGEIDWNVGASHLSTPDPGGRSRRHWNAGVGLKRPFGRTEVRALVMASATDAALLSGGTDGDGIAITLQLTREFERGRFGLLLTHATGEEDGSGFLPIMSVVRTNGYWGHTGILTVQGPTDTGFDGDAVNVSNNGYGLTSLQGRFEFPITERLGGYVAAGWFGNTDAAQRDSTLGEELMAMGTFHLTKILALDFGAAIADLGDGVSGYFQGAAGAFNQPIGVERTKVALFARLQAEF